MTHMIIIAGNVQSQQRRTMEKWSTELPSGGGLFELNSHFDSIIALFLLETLEEMACCFFLKLQLVFIFLTLP